MPENFSQLNLTTDNLTIYGPREVYVGDTVKLHCVSGPSIPGTAITSARSTRLITDYSYEDSGWRVAGEEEGGSV